MCLHVDICQQAVAKIGKTARVSCTWEEVSLVRELVRTALTTSILVVG